MTKLDVLIEWTVWLLSYSLCEGSGGFEYTLHCGAVTWESTRDLCQTPDTSMLLLKHQAIFDVFQAIVLDWRDDNIIKPDEDIWLGLYDAKFEDQSWNGFYHVWTDGSSLQDFPKWANWEPDELKVAKCVRLTHYWRLKTRECFYTYAAVCQKPIDCWFEDVLDRTHSNDPGQITLVPDLSSCQGRCASFGNETHECVSLEFAGDQCQLFYSHAVTFRYEPPTIYKSGSVVLVKRCYKAKYVPCIPVSTHSPIVTSFKPHVDLIATSTWSEAVRSTSVAVTSPTTISSASTISASSSTITTTTTAPTTATLSPNTASTTNATISRSIATIKSTATNTTTATSINTTATSASTATTSIASSATTTTTSIASSATTTTASIASSATTTTTSIVTKPTTTTSTAKSPTTTTASTTTSATTTTASTTIVATTTITSTTVAATTTTTSTTIAATTESACFNHLANTSCGNCFYSVCDGVCLPVLPSDQEKWMSLLQLLLLDKHSLSSYKRSKSSAEDDRPSAIGLGACGVSVLVAVGVTVLALDVDRLCECLRDFYIKKGVKKGHQQ